MILHVLAQAAGASPLLTPGFIATPLPVDVAHVPDDSIYVKVTAAATLLAAIPALAAVAISWHYSQRMFDESRASNEQTRTDVRLDRENGWKPHLAFNHPPIQPVAAEQRVVAVTNIGKGPALECRYVARLPAASPRYFRAPLFAVGAESELQRPRFVEELDPVADAGSLKLAQRAFDRCTPDENEVILCSDAFGNRWRFVRGRGQADGPAKGDVPSTARPAPVPQHWWQGWTRSGVPAWMQRVRDAEHRAAAEALARTRRRDARAAYGEFLDRFNDFATVRGILDPTGGRIDTAPLAPSDNNAIRAFGNWAETVAERVEHGDLDRTALADAGLIQHLVTFRSEVSADTTASALMQSWPCLGALHP